MIIVFILFLCCGLGLSSWNTYS
ncbi:hypothetical protein, partial [Plasmodium yoelii yoelii]